MKITAKFASTCSVCAQQINPGETIEWAKGKGSTHLACIGKTPVPLNSRPPAQMIAADADLTALAAKHGRTIAGEPKLLSFMTDEATVGQIRKLRKKDGSLLRRLVLAVGPARYYSASFLEDMDMFDMRPGRYSDCQCVAVEPTEAELADDAKAAAVTARKKELESILRNCRNAQGHLGSSQPAGITMTEIHGESRQAGSEAYYLGSDGVVYYMSSDYDMGPNWWRTTVSAELIAEAKAAGVKA